MTGSRRPVENAITSCLGRTTQPLIDWKSYALNPYQDKTREKKKWLA
jgi:hypothetical protein